MLFMVLDAHSDWLQSRTCQSHFTILTAADSAVFRLCCCAFRQMNYCLQKVMLHDPCWLSKAAICPLSPTNFVPGGGKIGYTQIMCIDINWFCHNNTIVVPRDSLCQIKNIYTQLYGLKTDLWNLHDLRRILHSTWLFVLVSRLQESSAADYENRV